MRDNRSLDDTRVEYLDDGLFLMGNNINNIPEYKFYGEKTKIRKITEKHLSSSLDHFLNTVRTFAPDYSESTVLLNISGPLEHLFFDNSEYYVYTKEFVLLPENTIDFPEKKNYKINKQTQVSLAGYTLTGEPIISGGSKGLIISESFMASDSYLIANNLTQGSTVVDENNISYLITSISKNDKKIINGIVYYNISITKQEL